MTRQHIGAWLGGGLALVLATGFALLGAWQLERGAAKQALLDARAAALAAPPVPLARALERPAAVQSVTACGRWEGPVVVLDSQQRGGRPGHAAYQALRLAEGRAVLVELGWRPWDGRRTLPPAPPLHGHTCLAGLWLPLPAPGLGRAAPAPQALPGGGWLLARLAADTLATVPGLPALADRGRALRPPPDWPGGYARDLGLLPNTLPPERHLGYAVQWFGLALTVLVVAGVLAWRRWRPSPRPASRSPG